MDNGEKQFIITHALLLLLVLVVLFVYWNETKDTVYPYAEIDFYTCYDIKTMIVYRYGGHGRHGSKTPYYGEHGKLCKYDPVTGQIYEIPEAK